jgi:hypothetical protein
MRRLSVQPRRATTASMLALAGLSVLALTLVSSALAVVHIEGQPPRYATSTRVRERRRRMRSSARPARSAPMSPGARSGRRPPSSATTATSPPGCRRRRPAAAAASWLAAHKALFRLRSIDHLRLDSAAPLRGQPCLPRRIPPDVRRRAVGGRHGDCDGGPAQRGWNVVYASSSLTPDAALTGSRSLTPLAAWRQAARATGAHVGPRGHDRQHRDRSVRRLRRGLQRRADGPTDRLRHAARRSAPRLRGDGDRQHGRPAELVPGRRRRCHRKAAPPREPRLQLQRQPDVARVPGGTAVQPDERLPMELLEHRHEGALLLDRDRGLRARRLGRLDDLPAGRCLEVPVGRAARLGRKRPPHDPDDRQQRGRGAALER